MEDQNIIALEDILCSLNELETMYGLPYDAQEILRVQIEILSETIQNLAKNG